jgi:hypothetical protein
MSQKIHLSISVKNICEMQSMDGGGGTSILYTVPLVAKVKPQTLTEYEARALTKPLRNCP